MKSTKDSQAAKEELEKKQRLKEAAEKKKEKQDAIDAKKRIQAKIEADKEARRLKAEQQRAERAGVAAPTAQPTTAQAPTRSKPASAYTESRLRFQSPNGNIMKTLPAETTLFEIVAALKEQDGIEVESFIQTFPKKVFNSEYFGESLRDLGLVPSASLVIQ